jgi:hypothetical protein
VVDAVRQHDAVPRWDNLNKWFKVWWRRLFTNWELTKASL